MAFTKDRGLIVSNAKQDRYGSEFTAAKTLPSILMAVKHIAREIQQGFVRQVRKASFDNYKSVRSDANIVAKIPRVQ